MMMPLSMVASVEVASGPAQISRDSLQRRISVQANVRGRDVQSFVDAAQAAVKAQVTLPPRYSSNGAASSRTCRRRPPG